MMFRAAATRFAWIVLAGTSVFVQACGPRVEYRVRPGFLTKAELPDEVVLADGTIIRYRDPTDLLGSDEKDSRPNGRSSDLPDGATPTGSLSWVELDDGTVRMQAERADQVVMLTMRAFREERYGELWEQLVSEAVRTRAEDDGNPRIGTDGARKRFVEWCAKNRADAMTLLNRMSFSFGSNTVVFEQLGGGVTRLRLSPQVTKEFKFRTIEVSRETTPEGDRMFLGGLR